MKSLVAPHGGVLVDLVVDSERAGVLKEESAGWPSWTLTPRQVCDLELLACGGFSPLRGFMSKADYESVCSTMRLADGTLWPMPIMLELPGDKAAELELGSMLALRDAEGVMLAALRVEEVWQADRAAEAQQVFGTTSTAHPGVAALLRSEGWAYVSGTLEVVQEPMHYDFRELRLTPAQLRSQFAADGWTKVVAFQTRNPLHRAHVELTMRAAAESSAKLLLHPVVGLTKPGDVDHFTRVRCYQAVAESYPEGTARLSLLPLAMRMGGPREALWHAIIRKNHGVSHFIVGRDHAGPGKDTDGTPFYGPYDAQQLLLEHQDELGVTMVPFRQMLYVEDLDRYMPEDEVPAGARTRNISGTEQRRMLNVGLDLPSWFTPPAVARELRRSYPPRREQGVTVFFTGLSGAGKSTVANVLVTKLLELGGRRVTLLDGDLVRQHLSSELGFSREHRDLNIRRIGFVAAEITKNGGVAICAPIAPYDATRKDVRSMVEQSGAFVLVHIATAIEVCEQRDRKGLYAKARAGLLTQMTGVDDPYEVPEDAELTIDTTSVDPETAATMVIDYMRAEGYLPADVHAVAEAQAS